MAVILDIDMPEHCGKCPLNDDSWGCIITGKPVQEDGRPETCPLHETYKVWIDLSTVDHPAEFVNLTMDVLENLFPQEKQDSHI